MTKRLREMERILKASLWDLHEVLRGDADHWWSALKGDYQDEFLRRAAVRATFACIEGIVFGLKQLLLALHERKSVFLSAAEQALLNEAVYDLDDKGRPKERMLRIPLERNLAFAFDLFTDKFLHRRHFDRNAPDWANFREAMRIRNRLMHPKTPANLRVSDEEIQVANRVYSWFCDLFDSLFRPTESELLGEDPPNDKER